MAVPPFVRLLFAFCFVAFLIKLKLQNCLISKSTNKYLSNKNTCLVRTRRRTGRRKGRKRGRGWDVSDEFHGSVAHKEIIRLH